MDLSALQKCTAAMKMLVCGEIADATYEYFCLVGSTALEAMKRFVRAMHSNRNICASLLM
jgi:hypothetical protein